MAGEIIKTQGIVLAIRPWSQTSHVVTWLTPDHGPVTTLVKGAVRAKSAFLGQYDLFYRCDLLYYARASGDLHALREVTPRSIRTHLRGDWRATHGLVRKVMDLCAEEGIGRVTFIAISEAVTEPSRRHEKEYKELSTIRPR